MVRSKKGNKCGKFYIVTEKSLIYKAYFRWQQNADVKDVIVVKMSWIGMELKRRRLYWYNENYFIIYPTEHDIET